MDDPAVRDSPEFHNCVMLHRRIHAITASVLKLPVSGKKETAREAMDVGGEFANASMNSPPRHPPSPPAPLSNPAGLQG